MSTTMDHVYGVPVEIILAASEGDIPSNIVIVPTDDKGLARCTHGDFHLTAKDAQKTIDAFEAHGVDIVIDYEHASAPGVKPAGERNPAAGWIKKLSYKAGVGLMAVVEWTKRARETIAAKEYRYLSPAVWLDKRTRHVLSLVSAGLVHSPAMVGMPPLTASKQRSFDMGDASGPVSMLLAQEGAADGAVASADMLVGELKAALEAKGADPGSTLESVLTAAIAAVKGDKEGEGDGDEAGGDEIASAARKALGLADDADAKLVTAKIKELEVHLGHTRNEDVAAMKSRLDVLDAAEADRAAEALLTKHTAKLNPNNAEQRKVMLELAKTDAARCEAVLASLPDAIPPQGETDAPKGTAGGRAGVIALAKREFEGEPQLAKINDVDTWVNGALAEKKMAPLTTEELVAV